jgi:N4-(beta-N-acetylglucosaminyl)-L-asparaginase
MKRLINKVPGSDNYQVGVLALDYKGRIGACSVQHGFTYAVANAKSNNLLTAKSILKQGASI